MGLVGVGGGGGDSGVCRVLKPLVSSVFEPVIEPGAEGLRGNRELSPLSTSYRLGLFSGPLSWHTCPVGCSCGGEGWLWWSI